ncbi:MAG: hypothetical protein ACREL9_10810 [Gemmatimonadales bacterium]
MRGLVLGAVLVAAVACAAGSGGSTADPAPATAPVAAPPPTSTLPPAAAPPVIRLGPSALRYAVQRQLHIEQDLPGQVPTDLSYRVYLAATILGPADTAGYPVTFTVDSMVADSGTYVPPTINLAAARSLLFTGRLAPTGELRNVAPSDSVVARSLGQLLGSPREFFPRLPAGGLLLGSAWVDTVVTTERGSGGSAEVTVRAVNHSSAARWEDRNGVRCLRIDVTSTFTLQGAGQQGGQSYELTGEGTRAAIEFVSIDGRYLGGESLDSTRYTVKLPAQGFSVPVRQVLRAIVTVLP